MIRHLSEDIGILLLQLVIYGIIGMITHHFMGMCTFNLLILSILCFGISIGIFSSYISTFLLALGDHPIMETASTVINTILLFIGFCALGMAITGVILYLIFRLCGFIFDFNYLAYNITILKCLAIYVVIFLIECLVGNKN